MRTPRQLCQAGHAGAALVLCAAVASCTGGGVESVGFPLPPPVVADTAFVVTTDLQTGSFATFPIAKPESVAVNLGRIHSDAVARTAGGLVWIVNRLGGDSIRTLDPAAGFATLRDCSVGNGSNPHDIVFGPDGRGFVPLYESATLAIIDPTVDAGCAGFVTGGIDLSAFADADGIPEMDQAAVVGDRLFVTLERLDRAAFFQPTDESLIAVIDLGSDTVVDTIRLTGTNPFTGSKGIDLEPTTGKALITEVGSFGVIGDGGVERVDLEAGVAEGFFVSETDLGANITDFVLARADVAFALTLDPDGINRLVRLDPSAPADPARRTVLLTSTDFLVDIELSPDRRSLYLTDRTLRRPGIRVFSVDDGREITAAPLDTGLPPFDLLFLDAAIQRGGGSLSLAPPRKSIDRGGGSLSLAPPRTPPRSGGQSPPALAAIQRGNGSLSLAPPRTPPRSGGQSPPALARAMYGSDSSRRERDLRDTTSGGGR